MPALIQFHTIASYLSRLIVTARYTAMFLTYRLVTCCLNSLESPIRDVLRFNVRPANGADPGTRASQRTSTIRLLQYILNWYDASSTASGVDVNIIHSNPLTKRMFP